MNFISAEEFLQQPKEVQQVFLDWWQPSIGDLYFRRKYEWTLEVEKCDTDDEIQCVAYSDLEKNKIIPTIGEAYSTISNYSMKDEVIPLLTEGQLRQFIEDKSDNKIDNYYCNGMYTIDISEEFTIRMYDGLRDDLLQAYWAVACKIVKESIRKIHNLKILPEYFKQVKSGKKTFELRKNDRDFKVDDRICLQEYDGDYTGNEICKKISYIFKGGEYGLSEDYCILGLEDIK